MAEKRRYSEDEVELAKAFLSHGISLTPTESRAMATEPAPAPAPEPAAPAPAFQIQRPEPTEAIPGAESLLEPVPHQGLATRIAGTDIQSPYSAATLPRPGAQTSAQGPPPSEMQGTGARQPVRPPGVSGAGVPRAPAGPPGWLQKEMAPEVEGTIRRKPSPIVEQITPEEAHQIGSAEDEAFAAGIEGIEAEEQGRQAERRAVQASLDRQEAIEADIAAREQERQRQLRVMEADYRQLADQMLAEPIDSNRIWNNKSTGEKILSRIQLAVSTLGFGIAGQENPLIQQLENEAERDLDAQKANKALQQSRLAAEGTLYGMARDRFASASAQDAVMREVQYRKIAQQLEMFRDFTKDPARRAAMDQAIAEWNMKLSEAERGRRIATETDELQKRRIAAAAAARPDPMDALIRQRTKQAKLAGLEREILGGPKPEDAPKLEVPGYGRTRTPAGAEKGNELVAAADETNRLLNELRSLRQKGAKTGALGVGSQEYHDASTLRQQLVQQTAKVISGGGTVQQGERDIAEKLVPDPTSWSDAKYDAAEKAIRQKARAQIEAWKKQNIAQPEAPK